MALCQMFSSIFNQVFSVIFKGDSLVYRTSLRTEMSVWYSINFICSYFCTIGTLIINAFESSLFMSCIAIILPQVIIAVRKLFGLDDGCDGLNFTLASFCIRLVWRSWTGSRIVSFRIRTRTFISISCISYTYYKGTYV